MSKDPPDRYQNIREDLLQIIEEVLGEKLPAIPVDTPILDFVLSSLELVEGMRRIYEHFGVLVSIRRVIEGEATLEGIAAYIEQELQSPARRSADGILVGEGIDDPGVRNIPLSPSQHHVGFLFRYSPEAAAAFNESLAVRLDGPLDGPALQSALDGVVDRYEALRSSLEADTDHFRVHEKFPLELQAAPVSEEGLGDLTARLATQPFAVDQRLFRAALLRVGNSSHVLLLTGHALLVDQDALHVVLADLAEYYSAYTVDLEPEMAFPALQWSDYLAMGAAEVLIEARHVDERFWQQTFASIPPLLELPTDRLRPAVKKYVGARLQRALNASMTKALRAGVADLKVQLSEAFLAAFSIYLGQLSGQPEFVLGVQSSPLYLDSSHSVAGPTRTMLPIPMRYNGGLSFRQILEERLAATELADAHRNFSLGELVSVLTLQRDQSRSPLFTIAYSYQPGQVPPVFTGLDVTWRPINGAGARYDIELRVEDTPSEITLICDYSTELFAADTISNWIDGVLTLLSSGLADPDTPAAQLPVMPEDIRLRVLDEWNRTEMTIPDGRTVLDLFLDWAAETPDAPAIRCGTDSLSYSELANRTKGIALALVQAAVRENDRVGILIDRSPDMLAAMLAVWQVGAQYVPLDLNFPVKRLLHMLRDADVACLLTVQPLAAMLPEFPKNKILTLPTDTDSSVQLPVSVRPVRQEDPANIIYTSGSTGLPKGVQIGQRALLNILLSVKQAIGFGKGDAFLATTTISFDISGTELFLPLISGGIVDLAPDEIIGDGLRLAETIADRRPKFVQATPSIWKAILSSGLAKDPERIIISAGEAMSRNLAEELLEIGQSVWNFYGPTETTIYSAMEKVDSQPDQPVSIGRPVANTSLYVLDTHHQPVAPGVVGELFISGAGLALCYWRKPEQTDERFVANPFQEGEKMYRTGDLARHLPDGRILCLGRSDDQVKVHGVRVELGEIEAALLTVPGLIDAVVTAFQDDRGDTQLVGHLIAAVQPVPSGNEIRVKLRETLPAVMIPPYFLFRETFPLTENGKVRRAALPDPDFQERTVQHTISAPQTDTEMQMARIWAGVLQIDQKYIGRESDFMDLGGHSLLITPLMISVREEFRVSFSMREFFESSTLLKFAGLVDGRRQESNGHPNIFYRTTSRRNSEWGRQRMAFLAREAELPPGLAPTRGMVYQPVERIRKLFMTGATGFLGAYLIDEILRTTKADLYCLVRPKRGEDGRMRIEQQMRHYAVWREDPAWLEDWEKRVHIVNGDVTLPHLGIDGRQYDWLAGEVDAILHGAAHVNFIYPYEALRGTNVHGVHEVIRFALQGRIKPVHHISTAAIWPMGAEHTFYEKDPLDHGQVLNLGYDEAKWVAEKTLLHAEERGLPSTRYRPGEVGGDSRTGRCVTDHFLIASIKGFLQFGAFPDLDIEVDVAPVDYVARAMTHILFNNKSFGRAFHLTNPSRIHMRDALTFLRTQGYPFEIMRFEDLRDRLIAEPGFARNALFAYQAVLEDMDDISLQLPTYDTRETDRALRGSGILCPPADEKLFGTYLDYLSEIGFLPQAEMLKR